MPEKMKSRAKIRNAAVLLAAVALSLSAATAALAGNGLGAYISLGFNNTIGNYVTSLTATVNGTALRIVNLATSGTGTRALYAYSRSASAPTVWAYNNGGGTALALTVHSGKPPLQVTNPAAGTATNLSADKLDGLDSSRFTRDIAYVAGTPSANNSIGPKSSTATCPAGKYLLGGGGSVTAVVPGDPVVLSASQPNAGLITWTATAVEGSAYDGNWSVTAYAICATTTP